MDLPQMDRAFFTDLYELTMAAAYFELGMEERAAFELTVRRLPPERSYLLCAGLAQAVSYLRRLRFGDEQIAYLREQDVFQRVGDEFFDYLAELRFAGTVHAVPEGTLVFAGEPLLRVEAPILQAQIVETFLLSVINFQTMVATKAARVVEAARLDGRERAVVDFGTRRAHGPDAAVMAARAAYLAGCAGTSNVEAGHKMGIPVSGTEAHSFIMAFDDEEEAFSSYYRCFGEHSVMLIDTYDTMEGARRAIRAAPGMRGVRLDSGDLAALSNQVRALLDEAGLEDALIFASGDLDEHEVARLVRQGAPVDGFGVGTRLVTSSDAPYLGAVYKLVAVERDGEWQPRLKLSADKETHPGLKTVFRFSDADGRMERDVLATAEEPCPDGAEALLEEVLREGEPTGAVPSLEQARQRAARQLARLPEQHRRLQDPVPYPVDVSAALRMEFRALAGEAEGGEDG
jgi:nicotinate phosphoribosyltransferase